MNLPASLEVLRDRQFRLLFSGQAVSLLGDGMVNVALAFAVLELGGDASDIGLVLAARAIALVACLLIGGVAADRIGPKRVMVGADLVRLASQGALAALLISGNAEIWMLAVLAGVTGAATGLFNPASTGLLPSVIPHEHLQEANSLRGIMMAAGEVAGPVLAGILVATAGAGWALALDAVTFAISAAFISRLATRRLDAATEPATFLSDLVGGWRAFVARRWVWAFVAGALVGNMANTAWWVLGPVIADRDLGGAAVWGVVVAGFGAGGLIGGLVALRIKPRRPMLVVLLAVSLDSPPLIALALGAPVVLIAAACVAAGCGLMICNTVWESTLQRHVPAGEIARVSSYDWFASMAFAPLGMALWGPIAGAIGEQEALLVAAGLMIASIALTLVVREIRELGPYPAPASTSSTVQSASST